MRIIMHARSNSSLKLVMVLGSVRQGRMVDRVAKFVLKTVDEHNKSISVTSLDPLQLDSKCQLNRQPLHFLSKSDKIPSWMQQARETISNADGFLILSTEYNGFMPPALLNLMNSLPTSTFRHRPVGLVTYTIGTSGAMRALSSMRSYVCELGLLCVPGYVPISMVHETIDQNGNCNNELVHENMRKLVGNLEWYSCAIQNYRHTGKKPHDWP